MRAAFLKVFFLALVVIILSLTVFAGTAGTAVRTLPVSYTAGVGVPVSIDMTPLAGTTVFGVSETYPSGWVLSDVNCTVVSTGAFCSSGDYTIQSSEVQWGITDGLERNLTYKVTPPAGTTGTKTFSGSAIDYVGSAFNSITITGATSIYSPSQVDVNITTPANGATFTNVAAFDVNAIAHDTTQTGSISNVKFYLDGNATPYATSTLPPYTSRLSSLSIGSHTISAIATSSVGLTATSTITITITDGVAPTVSITAPTSGATVSGSNVTLSANANDNVGVLGVQFKIDGVNVGTEDTSSPYSITWDSNTVANGTHTVSAVARDGAGLSTTSVAVSFTVSNSDTVAPVISSVASSSITRTGATITWTTNEASDTNVDYGTTTSYGASAFSTTSVTSHSQVITGLAPATLYHYHVKSKDSSQNLATSIDYNFTTLTNTAPVANAQSVTTAEDTAKAITLTGSDADSDTLTYSIVTNPTNGAVSCTGSSCTYTPTSNYNGTDSFTFRVYDGYAYSAAATVTITVTPVNDPPTLDAISNVTINEDAGAQTVNLTGISTGAANEVQTLTVTATSSNTNIIPNPTVTYTSPNATGSLAFTPVANANGVVTITVTVNDNNGTNNTVTKTFTVTVNPVNDPPTISTIAAQSTNEDTPTGSIAFTVGDIDTALTSLTVTGTSSNTALVPNANIVISGTTANRTVVITPAANQNGSTTITLTVSDGSLTATTSFVLTVISVNDPPTFTSFTTNGTTFAASARIDLNAVVSDIDGTISQVQFFNGANSLNIDTTFPYSYSWTNVGVGTYSLSAKVTDNNGAVTTSSIITVTVNDINAPNVSITAPSTNGAMIKGTISLNADANDNVAVLGVQFKVDGVNVGAEDTNAPYSVSWNSTSVADGSHTVSAVARDSSQTTTATINIIVDNTAPTLAIISSANNAKVSGNNVVLSADANDAIGVTSVQFNVDGVLKGTDTTKPYTFTWDSNTVADGNHKLTFIASDAALNTRSLDINVLVDNGFHPADTAKNWDINFDEYLAYSSCWHNPQVCNWNGTGKVTLDRWANAANIWVSAGQFYKHIIGGICTNDANSDNCWKIGAS